MNAKSGSVRKVLLTRETADNFALRTELEKLGFGVIEVPAIETAAVKPSNGGEIIAKWESFDWMVFSSRRSVVYVLEWMKEKRLVFPSKARYAAVGKATAAELTTAEVTAVLVPAVEDGEHLGSELLEGFAPSSALFPSSGGGLRTAQDILIKGNWAVSELELYETRPRRILEKELLPLKKRADLAFFASPSALDAFAVSPAAFEEISGIPVLPIGATTRKRALELGLNVITSPIDTGLAAILNAILTFFEKKAP